MVTGLAFDARLKLLDLMFLNVYIFGVKILYSYKNFILNISLCNLNYFTADLGILENFTDVLAFSGMVLFEWSKLLALYVCIFIYFDFWDLKGKF